MQFVTASNCVQSLRTFDYARLPAVAMFSRDCVRTIAAIWPNGQFLNSGAKCGIFYGVWI